MRHHLVDISFHGSIGLNKSISYSSHEKDLIYCFVKHRMTNTFDLLF